MAHAGSSIREWRRETANSDYVVSTSIKLLDRDFVNHAFASEDTYWAKPLPLEQLETMLSQSTTLGLYKVSPIVPPAKSADSPSSPRTPSPTLETEPEERLEQIGMARWITDRVTTCYLTDVYVLPEYRTRGLGKWLIACCKEVMDGMPALRRGFLMTDPVQGRAFYSKEMDFWDVRDEAEYAICMTRRAFKLGAH